MMAEKVYILGDLFDVWVGKDIYTDFHQQIAQAFKTLSNQGVSLYFMAGNRDFLLQKSFLKEAGITQLKDPSLIELHGRQVLLSHGDKLCTQDIVYQRYRRVAQHPITKFLFLLLPKKMREKIAQKLRQNSKRYQQRQTLSLLDVWPPSVEKFMKSHQVSYLIHGHVHRPQFHALNNQNGMRFVLGDWHEKASFIFSTPAKISLATFCEQNKIEIIESYAFDAAAVC